jgi:hypothetical protein
MFSLVSEFYRNFSSICVPILDTIKKEHGYFNWRKEPEKGFRVLKENITEQLVLVLPFLRRLFRSNVKQVE